MSYWPSGMKVGPIGEWPGAMSSRRSRSPFSASLSTTMETLRRELREVRATNTELLIAIDASKFRLDGYPRAGATPEHPGVILSFDSTFGHLSYPCDRFKTWEDNLRAVALALEALRKVDRYGVTRRGEQYRGFLAIEATAMPAGIRFDDRADAIKKLERVAGVAHDDLPSTEALIRRAKFRSHPDTITVDNAPEDYQIVLAAEQYLKDHA